MGRMSRIQKYIAGHRYVLLATHPAAKATMLNEDKFVIAMRVKTVMNIRFRKNRIGIVSHQIEI